MSFDKTYVLPTCAFAHLTSRTLLAHDKHLYKLCGNLKLSHHLLELAALLSTQKVVAAANVLA